MSLIIPIRNAQLERKPETELVASGRTSMCQQLNRFRPSNNILIGGRLSSHMVLLLDQANRQATWEVARADKQNVWNREEILGADTVSANIDVISMASVKLN